LTWSNDVTEQIKSSRRLWTAIITLILLLISSSTITIFEYNQTASLQNEISKQNDIINHLSNSLSLATMPLVKVCINADGSVTGTNSIQRSGDYYVLSDNITGSIIIQRSNMTLDGAGYTLQGYGGTGIDLATQGPQSPAPLGIYNVTVENLRIMNFNVSVWSSGGGKHTFYRDEIFNTTSEVAGGIYLHWDHGGSNISYCSINTTPAVALEVSSGNIITENNLRGHVWLLMASQGTFDRNYWSDYLTRYPNASEIGSSGIGDTPYQYSYNQSGHIGTIFLDNNPLMKPISISLPSPSPRPTPDDNQIDMWTSGLPQNIIEKLKPIGTNGFLNNSALNLVFALQLIKNYTNSAVVANALDSILADGSVNDNEVAAFGDLDHDYISNRLEVEKYHTDPTKADTSSLGIDDFNAIFTYGLDPNNRTQIQQFLAAVPNVSPRQWFIYYGGVGDTSDEVFVGTQTNSTTSADASIVEVSMRDPLIQWYARHSVITWDNVSKTGNLLVNGTSVWGSYDYGANPSYYFTHGRIGRCGDTTLATMSILNLMGYKTLEVTGWAPSNGTLQDHVWCETIIDGNVYVVNFGELIPRGNFYQLNGWVISESNNYNPDWYNGAFSDDAVLQTALVIGSSIAVAVVVVVYWKKRKR
jgi:hypothetical protein